MNMMTEKGLMLKKIAALIFITSLVFASCKQKGRQEKVTNAISTDFQWEYAIPESQGMSSQKLDSMRVVLAERGTKKLLIIKNDKIVYEWFAPSWEDSVRMHYTASLAKALVGGMSLLSAISDGYIHLDESACNYIPSWKTDNSKSKITIRQLATHTSGIEDAEANETELKLINSSGLRKHNDLPGWKGQFWRMDPDPFSVARDHAPVHSIPGEKYAYSNPGIAMLTYAVTASLKDSPYHDIRTYLKQRVFDPIGLEENEYKIGYGKTFDVDGLKLVPSWGGGSFTTRAIARIGLLMLHKGTWQDKQIFDSINVGKVTRYYGTALPQESIKESGVAIRAENNSIPATTAGWYCNYNGVWGNAPRDAFAGSGAQNQHLLVIPSLDMVIVRMGAKLGNDSWQGFEKYLVNPIMDAIEEPPYPKSDLYVEFAPKETVVRMALGGDNWPATWADDGGLYTAYGDGKGFIPNTDIKLSLGLAKVTGNLPFIQGANIRSSTGERVGQGQYGEKASGMLMIDGVLYMLVRNARNAKLMWSSDHGKNWEEADWKFDVSFGCPTFLNFGKNYEGAVDNYVYIYSQDDASAYKNTDHFVLVRVPKDKIINWCKYEYFAGYDAGSKPKWSEDIRKREPVFTNPGKCYRSGVTYSKVLKRYLWCQIVQLAPSEKYTDVRFKGGLGIFESQNPWGPWKTIYYTRDWDIGPGDTASIPAKWMSDDGTICYLLFSGDDCFSIRKMEIKVCPDAEQRIHLLRRWLL